MSAAQERFRNIHLQEEYDIHEPEGDCSMLFPSSNKSSQIVEIVSTGDIVFALTQSGICAAVSRDTNKRICFLNVSPDEVIRSLFYNKIDDSLITVSVYASDRFSSLKCKTTKIKYIRTGKPDAGFGIFESECLKWPGFVEFDDVNGIALTFSSKSRVYKVFDLKTYMVKCSISDKNIQEIKISPGFLLLILERANSHVPFKILSIEDGTVVKTFNHILYPNKKIDFIELFNEKLLIKQKNEDLQILNIHNFELKEVSRSTFMTPSAFIYLYEKDLFLTFRNRKITVLNSDGDHMTSFEDCLLPDCRPDNIHITSDQDLLVSYCKPEGNGDHAEGFISVNSIVTGESVAKVKENDVTALFYDEGRNEIYTGNKVGLIHVWSKYLSHL